MRATVYYAPGDVRVESVPDPAIEQSTDAIVRITHACICGSDLWFYRGLENWQPGWRTGHEWMGIVEAVGKDVRSSWLPLPFLMVPASSAVKDCKPLAFKAAFGVEETTAGRQKPCGRHSLTALWLRFPQRWRMMTPCSPRFCRSQT